MLTSHCQKNMQTWGWHLKSNLLHLYKGVPHGKLLLWANHIARFCRGLRVKELEVWVPLEQLHTVKKHLLCFPIAPIFAFFLATTSLQCSTISFPPCRASVRKSHQISCSLKIFSTSLSESPFHNLCNSSNISSVYSSDNSSEFKKGRLSCLEKRSDALEYFLKM